MRTAGCEKERVGRRGDQRLFEVAPVPPMCLQEDCHLFASLLDETPQGILVVDEEGRIAYTNLAMNVMFLPVQLEPGTRLAEHEGMEDLVSLMKDSVAGEVRVRRRFQRPSPQDSEAGAFRTFQAMAAPWWEDGRRGTWVMVEEVTDEVHAERLHLDLIASTGHELRAPLSLIHGYIETLRNGVLKNTTSLERCLEVMDRHSRRMMRQLDDMVILAGLQGDVSLKKREFPARRCVEDAVEHLMPLLEMQEATMSLDFPATGGVLNGDRFYWDLVFTNLIEAALKRNAAPGLRLRVCGQWSDCEVILTLEDDGAGIPPDEMPFVPDLFHRHAEEHAPERRTSGLGLMIVKLAVEAHGGSIEVANRPEKGVVFTIRLPLEDSVSVRD